MQVTPDEIDEAMTHIDEHVTYPATKDDIVKACNEMSDVTEKEKKWVTDKLSEKTFQSAKEVEEALKGRSQAL